ncbi:MAG: hypothetical protein V1726_01850 [Methanobacteriota archaeon]
MKSYITLVIVFSMVTAGFPLVIGAETEDSHHVIAGVPYVGQTTDYYCAYASCAMVLGYYGVNVSVEEVLYESGVGYALVYSPPTLPRLPVSCTGSCRWSLDRLFLARLHGLNYSEWRSTAQMSEDDRWTAYWIRVKENLSNNHPVITDVDPVLLPSIRNAVRKELGVTNTMWMRLTNIFWNNAPCNVYHSIVLVGFNETNQTVCFNDPSAGLYHHPEEGTYVWMPLSTFKKAHHRLFVDTQYTPYLAYSVQVFTDTGDQPLNTTEIYQQTLERNLKKLSGDPTVYDDHIINDWGCTTLGFHTVQALHQDFSPGLRNRITTAPLYILVCMVQLLSLEYKLGWMFDALLPESRKVTTCPNILNKYRQIAIEKESVSQYLLSIHDELTNETLKTQCLHDAFLLQQEANQWTRLADDFARFLEKGMFMMFLRALTIIQNMYSTSETILLIETQLLEI